MDVPEEALLDERLVELLEDGRLDVVEGREVTGFGWYAGLGVGCTEGWF